MLTVLLLAAGVALIVAMLSLFGIAEVAALLAGARVEFVAAAVALQVVMLAILAWRMQIIAKREGALSFWHAFRAVNAGMVLNFLTPVAKIGGEPVKILLLRKRFGTSKAGAIVTLDTLVEVLSGFVAVLAIFLAFFRLIPASLLSSFIIFLAAAVVVAIAVAKVIISPGIVRRAVRWLVKRVARRKKIRRRDYASLFISSIKALAGDRTMMAKALGVSLGMKFLEFARMWLAFFALGFAAPLEVVIIAWAVMLILFMVPWLPGSLGLVEFGIAAVFVLFGVPSSVAAGGVLLDRFISFWFVLVLGIAVTGSAARAAMREARK